MAKKKKVFVGYADKDWYKSLIKRAFSIASSGEDNLITAEHYEKDDKKVRITIEEL